jgi:hypothetical protein
VPAAGALQVARHGVHAAAGGQGEGVRLVHVALAALEVRDRAVDVLTGVVQPSLPAGELAAGEQDEDLEVLRADLARDAVRRLQVLQPLLDLPRLGARPRATDHQLRQVLAVAEPDEHLPGLLQRRDGRVGLAADGAQLGEREQRLADPPAFLQLAEAGEPEAQLRLRLRRLAEVDQQPAGEQVPGRAHPRIGIVVQPAHVGERVGVLVAEHRHEDGEEQDHGVEPSRLVRRQPGQDRHRLSAASSAWPNCRPPLMVSSER